jgi:hypothetical protein
MKKEETLVNTKHIAVMKEILYSNGVDDAFRYLIKRQPELKESEAAIMIYLTKLK